MSRPATQDSTSQWEVLGPHIRIWVRQPKGCTRFICSLSLRRVSPPRARNPLGEVDNLWLRVIKGVAMSVQKDLRENPQNPTGGCNIEKQSVMPGGIE